MVVQINEDEPILVSRQTFYLLKELQTYGGTGKRFSIKVLDNKPLGNLPESDIDKYYPPGLQLRR